MMEVKVRGQAVESFEQCNSYDFHCGHIDRKVIDLDDVI
jgi:hypothetical protein